MRVLVVGGSGLLGTDVVSALRARGHVVSSPGRAVLDCMHVDEVARWIAGEGEGQGGEPFEWLVNCAAYTAVDKAESDEDQAIDLNVLAPSYLASSCSLFGTRMLHVSTDFVFDGESDRPYQEDDRTHPLGVYGRTKLEGEQAVLGRNPNAIVARTSWLYGPSRGCFPRTMIRLWLQGKPLRVVADQVGNPTYTGDLARVFVDLMEMNAPGGVLHTAGPESMSWHQFAELAVLAYRDAHGPQERAVEITPIKTLEYPTPAKRPAYSVLNTERLLELGIEPMRPVREALAEFVNRLPAEV